MTEVRMNALYDLYAGAKACLSITDTEVVALIEEVRKLQTAVRTHRDQRGDNRCWLDDETLYKTLPEGYTPPARDTKAELEMCQQFITCRHHPDTVYVSPQRRIEELEAEVTKLKEWKEKLQRWYSHEAGSVVTDEDIDAANG